MTTTTTHPDLSVRLHGEQQQVAIVTLTRPAKRNALNDGLILAIRDAFQNLPKSVRAAVIDGEGEHFCAGLDLSELSERDACEGIFHSRMWHAALECVEKGTVPVVAALHVRWSAADWSWPAPATSAWPTRPPSTPCPKAHAAS